MDDDEVFVLLVGIVGSLVGAFRWYQALTLFTPFKPTATLRISRCFLGLVPIVCIAALIPFLHLYAAKDVREDPQYLFLFTALGGTWISGAVMMGRAFGISARDDVLERGNPAAAIVIVATMIATTIVYALANVGEGATIWMTIGPAALATATMAVLWILFQLTTNISDAVTIDCDAAAAVRFAGLLIGIALILGHSVAGNYVSAQATFNDFKHLGWPAVAITIAAIAVHHRLKATAQNPRPKLVISGIIPGMASVAIALLATTILKRS